jgi:AcrR family transcriptional regulator
VIHLSLKRIENIPKQTPLTKKGEKTRQKLLDTAEEIFGSKGYFNTSIVDITQEAKVAQGTFYIYFPSKEKIFEELIKQLSSDFRNQIRQDVLYANSAKEAQMMGFKAFFRWVKNHRNLYSIVQQAIVVDEQLYRWYYERIAQGYINGLQEGMDQGEFKVLNTEAVAYALMGVAQFIGMRWVYWDDQDVPESVFEDAINVIFEGLTKR